jgi:hypothetical protein
MERLKNTMPKKPKTFNVLMSCHDEDTNHTGVRRLKLQAHTKTEAKKRAYDLIWSSDPWVIRQMSIDANGEFRPVELIDVFPSSNNDLPCRVWTPEEIEQGDLERLVEDESKPFSVETSAYHEAGHALVVHELGWDITEIQVYTERTVTKTTSEGGNCNYMRPSHSDDEDEILVSLGGPVAEAAYKGTEFSIAAMIGLSSGRSRLGGNGDFRDANDLAQEMHFSAFEEVTHRHFLMTEKYLEYMAQRVRVQFLDPHWETIDRIAKALIERNSLTGFEVLELLEEARVKAA